MNDRIAIRCHAAVSLALKSGALVRQPCEECGILPAQAHHDDYTKPLDVRWLCPRHHMAWHRHNPSGVVWENLPLSFRVSDDELRRIRELADRDGVTVSRVVRRALHEAMERRAA